MPKELHLEDGRVIHPDRMERPFVYVENDEPRVLSLAVKKGDESYLVFVPIKEKTRPVPNPRQLAWQQAELGAVFHYDLHVFDGKKYGQSDNRIDPVMDYQVFHPEKLNTDQWIKAIKDAGFTFAILTATHETGFALYQSNVNPYSMKALEYQDGKGDIVRDFVNSCRKYGIKPGIYLGIRWNSFLGVHDFKVDGTGEFRENRQEWYNHMVEGMVKEICTNYGELFEIWFDGGADHPDNGAPDVLPIVQQYQPIVFFITISSWRKYAGVVPSPVLFHILVGRLSPIFIPMPEPHLRKQSNYFNMVIPMDFTGCPLCPMPRSGATMDAMNGFGSLVMRSIFFLWTI